MIYTIGGVDMNNTLVIYGSEHESAKETAEILGFIIGNAKVTSVNDAPSDVDGYDNICLVFTYYGPLAAKDWVEKNVASVSLKKLVVVGVKIQDKHFFDHVHAIEKITGVDAIVRSTGMFDPEGASLLGEDLAAVLRAPEKKMDDADLKVEIEKILKEHKTLALATASETYTRCTPLEYIYRKNKIYILTEGGMKFRGLLVNKNVSFAIYKESDSMDDLEGLQVQGEARLVDFMNEEYENVLEFKGIDPEKIKAMPNEMHLICIEPTKCDVLCTAFKEKGFSVKQQLVIK